MWETFDEPSNGVANLRGLKIDIRLCTTYNYPNYIILLRTACTNDHLTIMIHGIVVNSIPVRGWVDQSRKQVVCGSYPPDDNLTLRHTHIPTHLF